MTDGNGHHVEVVHVQVVFVMDGRLDTSLREGPLDPLEPDPDALPRGWVACDGRKLSKAEYPILFSIIGKTYTPENCPAEWFCVPDYREHMGWSWNLRDMTMIDVETGHCGVYPRRGRWILK